MVTNGMRETSKLTAHCPGPRTAGRAVSAYKRFGGAKTLAQGGIHFRRASKMKGLPFCPAKWESNVQNPTFITTVWGYGYKWGA